MQAKKQTDHFIAALLHHGGAVEVMALRAVGTEAEEPTRARTVRSLADLERLRGWLWHENASRDANIFARPAPGEPHPWLFLDDVARPAAEKIAGRWACLVVETSPGNCQLRILTDRPLAESERTDVQRALAVLAKADPGSVAGNKWGRLPGFKNMKPGRGGCWTNLLLDTTTTARPLPADYPATAAAPSPGGASRHKGGGVGYPPEDAAGGFRAEFAWACHRLRDGLDVGDVVRLVADHAMRRGKRKTWAQAVKYAERTVAAAMRSLR
ncbi:MAG: DNA-primase RepB domain-containing protein [Betaproteobacteria bacterium]|nr:DNA-primase RepB domain-containing protein [Betaproteobacteria bacterium]